MATLTATPRTLSTLAPATPGLARSPEAVKTVRPAPRRPGFWTTLLRALAAASA